MVEQDVGRTEVRREQDGRVLRLVLDGPKTRNAIGPEVYEAVQAAVVTAGTDTSIGAIVVTGAGGFFTSGGNVRALEASARGTLAEATVKTDRLNAMIRTIVECPKPVIAAVEGGAAGAGFSLVLACDLIVAGEGASFAAAYVRVGLSPDGGITHFLGTALPRQLVMDMCLTGQPVAAPRLAAAGIVNACVPDGEALARAMDLATRLAAGPPRAIATIKRLVNMAGRTDLAGQMDEEARAINLARFGAEAAEGLQAFLARRAPDFNPPGKA
ncbi:oxepin-CoA hydrolase, alternative type [Phreatobacter cathodiphilus]|uniref:Enoyl-CoA hydratase n=1 Tax=Phreatobacter cathodiphilus TaxID=1868589 RepID=A0A2S0N8B1_9HYPH|nr:enoyl-CoA hydratase family protein [Phreatobacter cathodiphilus]AVO44171.1 enoyl-CoA hydratase [Phreatobacter cathodiphilus]